MQEAIKRDDHARWTAAFTSMKARGIMAMATFCCAVALSPLAAQTREVSGVAMPEAVSVAGRDLRLKGLGVRKEKVFFKAYVIALYLEDPATAAQAAIQTDRAWHIVMTMLRDVSREQFLEAIETGIMRNSKPAMPILRARLDLLERSVTDLARGDVIDLTWMPDASTIVHCQGQEITIPGKDFADALFGVWLGAKPIDVGLKRKLSGQ